MEKVKNYFIYINIYTCNLNELLIYFSKIKIPIFVQTLLLFHVISNHINIIIFSFVNSVIESFDSIISFEIT